MADQITVTVRAFHMADCPWKEAVERAQSRWGVFGETGPTRPDGQTGFSLTDVTVTQKGLESLQGAVAADPGADIVATRQADSEQHTTVEDH